jgi:hypothetical protein
MVDLDPLACPASSSVVRVLDEQGNRIAQIRYPACW